MKTTDDSEDTREQYTVLDHVPAAMCVIQKDYCVLFWNNCFEYWTGINRREMVGKDLRDFFPHFNEPKYYNRLENIFSGGAPVIFSSQLHKNIFPSKLPNGTLRILKTVVTSMPSHEKNHYNALFAVEDVTELTNRIIEYRIMRDKMIEQQKSVITEERLNVLLQMAGATAHDLNQPLTVLLGSIYLLRQFSDEPKLFAKSLTDIENAGQKMSEIIKKIQNLRYDDVIPYAEGISIINLHPSPET